MSFGKRKYCHFHASIRYPFSQHVEFLEAMPTRHKWFLIGCLPHIFHKKNPNPASDSETLRYPSGLARPCRKISSHHPAPNRPDNPLRFVRLLHNPPLLCSKNKATMHHTVFDPYLRGFVERTTLQYY